MIIQLSKNIWFLGVSAETKGAKTIRAQTRPQWVGLYLKPVSDMFILIVVSQTILKTPLKHVQIGGKIWVMFNSIKIHLVSPFSLEP